LIPRDQHGETSRELCLGYVNCGKEERARASREKQGERKSEREREREYEKGNMTANERK